MLVNFLNNKNQNKPLVIYGDGNQTRDFVNVTDVVDINIKASEHDLEIYGDIYNIGTGQPLSILNLALLITDNIEFTQPKIGELKHSCADINKTNTTFNWKPSINIENWLNSRR